MQDKILHIATEADISRLKTGESYAPDSLESEGFIHFSTKEQLVKTLKRFYATAEKLSILIVDTQKLGEKLKWEDADGDTFPHLYAPLLPNQVIAIKEISAPWVEGETQQQVFHE